MSFNNAQDPPEEIEKRTMDVQLNLRVDPAMKASIDLCCRERYTSVSQLMREAILDVLEKYGQPKPGEA